MNQAHLRKANIAWSHLWILDFLWYMKLYMYIWHKIDKKLPRATEVTGGRGSGENKAARKE